MYNEHGFKALSYESIQELTFKVKSLRKDFNKESQPALKRYLHKQLAQAEHTLDTTKKNQSGFKTPRAIWKKFPDMRFVQLN